MDNTIWIGNDKRGITWIKTYEDDNLYISMNNISYWCHILNVELRICIDTTEGKKLNLLLNEKDIKEDDIYDHLMKCLLQNITITHFISLLDKKYNEGHQAGKEQKISEIKKVLEIEQEVW